VPVSYRDVASRSFCEHDEVFERSMYMKWAEISRGSTRQCFAFSNDVFRGLHAVIVQVVGCGGSWGKRCDWLRTTFASCSGGAASLPK
jgi:hypothetical protein